MVLTQTTSSEPLKPLIILRWPPSSYSTSSCSSLPAFLGLLLFPIPPPVFLGLHFLPLRLYVIPSSYFLASFSFLFFLFPSSYFSSYSYSSSSSFSYSLRSFSFLFFLISLLLFLLLLFLLPLPYFLPLFLILLFITPISPPLPPSHTISLFFLSPPPSIPPLPVHPHSLLFRQKTTSLSVNHFIVSIATVNKTATSVIGHHGRLSNTFFGRWQAVCPLLT